MVRSLSSLLAVLFMSLFIGACGGSDDNGSGSASGGSDDPQMAEIAAEIEKYSQVPEYQDPEPGTSFDAKQAKGKTIFSIPISSDIPFINAIEDAQQKIAKSLGIKYISFKNQGSPDEWVRGMNQAIAQKVDLIILSALPNPADLQPQIKKARAAGIPVISTNGPDPEKYPPNTVPAAGTANLTSYVPGPFVKAAALQADWVINDSGGKANVLILTANDVLSAKGHSTMVEQEFKRRCPECKTKMIDTPVTDWATKIQTKVQTELSKDPSINYIVPIYSAMGVYAQPAITASGRRGQVKIVTYDGDTGALKHVQDGSDIKVVVGESAEWAAYAFMDRAMRILLDLPYPEKGGDPHIGIRIFTPDNVDEAGKPPVFEKGYGDAFKDGYAKLWQLDSPPTE